MYKTGGILKCTKTINNDFFKDKLYEIKETMYGNGKDGMVYLESDYEERYWLGIHEDYFHFEKIENPSQYEILQARGII